MDPTSPHFTPKSPIHVSKNAVAITAAPGTAAPPVHSAQSNETHHSSRESSVPGARSAPSKSILNCIVDDTALVQGAKEGTRDGFRKWIANGQMRLFVPLYALAQTSKSKDKPTKYSTDAEQALLWLDQATSEYPTLVTLQGGYDQFQQWSDVERYILPKSLLSESHRTPDTSPQPRSVVPDGTATLAAAPSSLPAGSITDAGSKDSSDIPLALRPLLNYILWRIHQETNPSDALRSFVFLTDDPIKQKCAQRFGVRTKTLREIRTVVAKQGQQSRQRDLSTRTSVAPYQPASRHYPTPAPAAPEPSNLVPAVDVPSNVIDVHDSVSANGGSDSDDDEILLVRPAVNERNETIVDPDQFSRNLLSTPRGAHAGRRGRGRGGASPRGGGRIVGRQSPATLGGANPNTPMSNRLTREQLKSLRNTPLSENKPIDPNSFSRPAPAKAGAARGGTPRLWNPV